MSRAAGSVKKLLITGGAGFIGSNFIHHVLDRRVEWQVVNLDKLTYAGNLRNLEAIANNPRYSFVKGDVADRSFVKKLFAQEGFEFVVNFAAESHVDRSMLDASPFVETNVKGTQILLDAARRHGITRFVQVSTDEVYGSLKSGVFTEDSPLLPNNPYAASKAAADLLCRAYHKAFRMPVVITRSSNNYGPYQFLEKLIPLMVYRSLSEEELPIYGRGLQVRDWLFVEDNCRAISLVLKAGRSGEIYNIGTGSEWRNVDVVQLICDVVEEQTSKKGLRSAIRFIDDPRGEAHDFRYALDHSKIRHELGWEPTVSFPEGVRRTVEWYLKNTAWVESVVTKEYLTYCKRLYGS